MQTRKVLIVDDDKEFLEECRETLALSGYDTVAVNNSLLALDIAFQTKPDVILLDLNMPNKNGFQLADELRHSPDFAQVPIIAVSAYFKDNFASLMNMCGISKCIRKPFRPLDIIVQIEEALQAGRKN